MEPNVLTVTQVAQRLGLTPGAVRNAIARGTLAVVRMGGTRRKAGHLLIPLDAAERYAREVRGQRGKYDRATKGRWHRRGQTAAAGGTPGAPRPIAEAVEPSEGAARNPLGQVTPDEREALAPLIDAWCAANRITREEMVGTPGFVWVEFRWLAQSGVQPKEIAAVVAFVRERRDAATNPALPDRHVTTYEVRKWAPYWRGDLPKDPRHPKRVFVFGGSPYLWTYRRTAKPTRASVIAEWERAGYQIDWIAEPTQAMRDAAAKTRSAAE